MKNAKKGACKPCANRPQNILQMTNMNMLLLSMFLYIYVCVIFPVTAGSFTYVLYMCILNPLTVGILHMALTMVVLLKQEAYWRENECVKSKECPPASVPLAECVGDYVLCTGMW